YRREGGEPARQGIWRLGRRLLQIRRGLGPAPLRPRHDLDPVRERGRQAVAAGPLRKTAVAVEDAVRRGLRDDVLEARRQRHRLRLGPVGVGQLRSEEHTSELQSHLNLVCRLLLEKKKKNNKTKQQSKKNQKK